MRLCLPSIRLQNNIARFRNPRPHVHMAQTTELKRQHLIRKGTLWALKHSTTCRRRGLNPESFMGGSAAARSSREPWARRLLWDASRPAGTSRGPKQRTAVLPVGRRRLASGMPPAKSGDRPRSPPGGDMRRNSDETEAHTQSYPHPQSKRKGRANRGPRRLERALRGGVPASAERHPGPEKWSRGGGPHSSNITQHGAGKGTQSRQREDARTWARCRPHEKSPG